MRFLFSFDGCVRRRDWWLACGGWVLFASLVDVLDGDRDEPSNWASLVILFSLWPLLAVTVKRWHDRGKSGLWNFIVLVPFIGFFLALIELGFLGEKLDNPYHEMAQRMGWYPYPSRSVTLSK